MRFKDIDLEYNAKINLIKESNKVIKLMKMKGVRRSELLKATIELKSSNVETNERKVNLENKINYYKSKYEL